MSCQRGEDIKKGEDRSFAGEGYGERVFGLSKNHLD